jgi:hypothetical protein
LKNAEKSKHELMEIGYDEIAIEDFYDLFISEVKKLKTIEPVNSTSHLMKLLGNKEEATYLIMYCRFMTSLHLKQNAFMFEGFVGEVSVFCI